MSGDATTTRRSVLAGAATALTVAALPRQASAALSGPPIKIGHQCDITGALASNGYWRRKAANAAVKWMNENGGIAGRPVEIVTVDTETKVDVGIARLRQLLQDQKVDFVLGSQNGGVALASNPIVNELKTISFSTSRTEGVTGATVNPYVFRLMVNTRQTAKAVGKEMIRGSGGKRWAILYADYVWGQSHREAWTDEVKEEGGTVVQSIPMPVNSNDPLSYIAKLDRSADGIFVALLGPDMPKTFIAMSQLGLTRKTVVTADSVLGEFDLLSYGKQAEGLLGSDSLPWELADKDTPALRSFRAAIGIDELGREIGTGKNCAMGEVWPAWESLTFFKMHAEKVGWKTAAETEALIRSAEANPNCEEGTLFPQGPLQMRPADHQFFCTYYTFRIEGGRIRAKSRLPLEAGFYPAVANIAQK